MQVDLYFSFRSPYSYLILPLQTLGMMPDDMLKNVKEMISKRQIARLWVVGSNNDTAPIIDASLRRLLAVSYTHLRAHET